MPYIEFKITDKTFFGLTPEQITSKLNNLAKAQMEVERTNQWSSGQQNVSKFPRWLRTVLRAVSDDFGVRPKWDSDNDTYGVSISGDLNDADDFYSEVNKSITSAMTDPDISKWFADNHIGMSISESNGDAEMADLENHSRGAKKDAPKQIVDVEADQDSDAESSDAEEGGLGT